MSSTLSYFVSDLHLCPTRSAVARLFLAFLAKDARQAKALYILGDLFEYWAGDDDLDDPFNASICAALKSLSANGTDIFFLAGNRDFLIGADFTKASGVILLDEPCLTTIGGISTLLMHGDTLCSDDTAYQTFRASIRNESWRTSFLALPLAERKLKIEEMRRRSEHEKQIKPAVIMDVNPDSVASTLRTHGYPRLIHGHTHRRERHWHDIDDHICDRWVLGDWREDGQEAGNYLRCTTEGCKFILLPQP